VQRNKQSRLECWCGRLRRRIRQGGSSLSALLSDDSVNPAAEYALKRVVPAGLLSCDNTSVENDGRLGTWWDVLARSDERNEVAQFDRAMKSYS